MKRNILITFVIALGLVTISCSNNNQEKNETVVEESTSVEQNENVNQNRGSSTRPGGMGAGANFLDDAAKANLKKVSSEVKDKYKEFVYTDEETGHSVNYGLFIPESYGRSNKIYPLIMFIGDATTTGNSITQILENCIGSVIWATKEEQEKHECFVLVPTFDERLIDDSNGNLSVSEYMDVIVRMIEQIAKDYEINKDKIYSTGQSMGCMTSLYLTANNPDLFAATLLVDGQWEISQIQGIKDRKFIYFAAEGDKKAYDGQTEVKNYLKDNNVEYAEVSDVDAKLDAESLNKIADDLFSKGLDKNFITWKLNSTYVNGESNGSKAGEHMTSFYYGYNIERVRDWLFEQDKHEGSATSNKKEVSALVSEIENKTIDPSIFLDYKKGIEEKVYKWVKSEDGKYYTFAYIDENGNTVLSNEAKINVGANNKESIDNGGDRPQGDRPQGERPQGNMPGGMMEMMMKNAKVPRGVYINANITNLENQTMLIYAPAEYFNVDEDGNVVSINYENEKNGYNAKTAPIVFLNECGGWRSSSPRSCETSYIDEGFVYVTCGARSRDAMDSDGILHTGKAPMQMADLKSGVIELRANDEVIPGNKNKIISIGTSGGGQMSSIFGASGDMKEYYPYMYEAGTLGVSKNEDGTYTSAFKDSIYAAQNYCPIADIENADMAYAWWWADLVDDGGIYNGKISDFEKRLQELEAEEYVKYLNSLNLKDKDGNDLTLTGLRSGTYYDAILNNLSDALNKYVAAGMEFTIDEEENKNWLTKDENGKYKITDLKGFMIGTGLVNNRNKAIPGFDAKDKSAENNAFGKADVDTVHFSKSTATILKDNYEELSKLDGFDKEQVDAYIEDCISGEDAELINNQTALLNATHILLGIDGLKTVNPVKHFRNRSGTADQHTSFGIGYNILTAAAMKGIDIDYSLVWNMQHGSNEGESTGTFIDWVNKISK